MNRRNDETTRLPPALAEIARRWLERIESAHGSIPEARRRDLARLAACSDFAAATLHRQGPDAGDFTGAPSPAGLERFAREIAASEAPEDEVKRELRQYRNRYLVRLLWQEVSGAATVRETLARLSELADSLIGAASRYAASRIEPRYGRVRDASGEPVPLVILGMGKLGGRELNFSSDIDVIFLYPRDGESDGEKRLPAEQYFARLSRAVVGLLDEVTEDGIVFRVDTRLRPFGESGPPVVSFAALEGYLLRHGRDWERYAYVKARVVGNDPGDGIRRELFDDLIEPFVYRMYLDYGVFESLRDMHAKIVAEVRRRELRDNVKLGPGGIREIEFIVQSLQLVRGGGQESLRSTSLLETLPLLIGARGISRQAAAELESAYLFLRRVENFLQGMRDRQTHDLPDGDTDRARLALAMGCADWAELEAGLDRHRRLVTAHFDAIAIRGGDAGERPDLQEKVSRLWDSDAGPDAWRSLFEEAGAGDGEALAVRIVAFRDSSASTTADVIAQRRLRQFVPTLVSLVAAADDPERALDRTLGVVENVLRRSAYLALLNENPLAAERLVRICEMSRYAARELERFPALLDELLDPGIDTEPLTRAQLEEELDDSLPGIADGESESQTERLAEFQRAVLFRIAVADFSDRLPIMKVSDSLTFLAETVIERALALAWRDLVERHGKPRYEVDGERRDAGFGVIAYGKLGGLELSYGSDLDLVFLHDSRGERQTTDGESPLENAVFFARLVRRLTHFLTTRTTSGVLYEIDTRLRPSGQSGLLVTSTEAFERYQQQNAWTWEHQALLRARPVAGSGSVAKEFDRIRAETLTERVRRERLADDVRSMRAKMRGELDRSGDDSFDLKQGDGGIADIEFLVQYLVLANANDDVRVIEFSDNIRQLDALAEAGIVTRASAEALQDVYRHYRRRLHRLTLNEEPPLVDAAAFEKERRLVRSEWRRHLG